MFTVKEILPNKLPSEVSLTINELELRKEYELNKCADWVKQRNAERVCVQFSPDQLSKAPLVVDILERELCQKLYILGDTSYGSCCVDEVTAQHIQSDAIIHFGHSCLSQSERIPVLYIFNKEHINIDEFFNCFQKTFNHEDNILLLYDVSFYHAVHDINQHLSKRYNKLIVSELSIEKKLLSPTHSFFGRVINLPSETDLEGYSVIFIGQDGPCIANFKYLFPGLPFYAYNPAFPTKIKQYDVNMSKFLQKRMFMIESLKNVRNLGILIGTLCVKSYLGAVERIKCLTKPKGIKCYIISVGRINVAKLANFPEIEAYVLISCAENSLLDSRDFLQSIVTPYEVELAFNAAYKWSDKFITDFTTLLPGCDNYVEENFNSCENEMNVSLITGNIRRCLADSDVTDSASTSIVTKGLDNLALAESHGSNFLTSRSWVGLEPKLGQTAVEKASLGRSGIPYKYKNESA